MYLEKFPSTLVEEEDTVEGFSVSIEVELIPTRVKVLLPLLKVTQQCVRVLPRVKRQ